MTVTSTRAAVATFLAAPRITGLNVVYDHKPKTTGGTEFTDGQPAGTESGAIAAVSITGTLDRRTSVDGAGGYRLVEHDVKVEIFHHSDALSSRDACTHLDTLLDSLLAQLAADPSMASTDVLDSAALIRVQRDDPVMSDEGAIETYVLVEFTVTEMVRIT